MPIQVLPPQLANQIAAGEVVERPASVVKELVENSIDAGATRIDIDIERGGSKLIRIRDNGCGIKKDELALALARHATSKISSLDDLEAIASLGFRGEALASISSVSRLTLTSRTAEQNEAWQAYAEGREMKVDLKPAAHPIGSSVEVLDLFYNTPARRKFLRTEKTEFNHIDEIIRRIALSHNKITFNLQHNGKMVRQYRSVTDEQLEKRLTAICGSTFMQHAVSVFWQHGDLLIRGWIATPEGAKQLSDLQYCYVNGRMIRDRLINHAIRQAYQSELTDDQQPAYILYIEIDPHQVDVNVHPAKHEVRFHQSRLVHDFIYQAIVTALQNIKQNQFDLVEKAYEPAVETRQSAGRNSFEEVPEPKVSTKQPVQHSERDTNNSNWQAGYPLTNKPSGKRLAEESQIYQQLMNSGEEQKAHSLVTHPPVMNSALFGDNTIKNNEKPVLFPDRKCNISDIPAFNQNFQVQIGKVLTIWQHNYAVVEYQNGLGLLSLTVAEKKLRYIQLTPDSNNLKSQPLLIPLRLSLSESEKQGYTNNSALLNRLGIEIKLTQNKAEVRAVPLPLRQQNLQLLFPNMLNYLSQAGESKSLELEELIHWLVEQMGSEHDNWSQAQAIQIITELERLSPDEMKQPSGQLIQPIDLQNALLALSR